MEYYYWLIPNLNNILEPLFQLASPTSIFVWLLEHRKVFNLAKRQLAIGPLLFMPSAQGPRHLVTDAAQHMGVASAIYDYDSKSELFLPLRYTSHSLKGSQKN